MERAGCLRIAACAWRDTPSGRAAVRERHASAAAAAHGTPREQGRSRRGRAVLQARAVTCCKSSVDGVAVVEAQHVERSAHRISPANARTQLTFVRVSSVHSQAVSLQAGGATSSSSSTPALCCPFRAFAIHPVTPVTSGTSGRHGIRIRTHKLSMHMCLHDDCHIFSWTCNRLPSEVQQRFARHAATRKHDELPHRHGS